MSIASDLERRLETLAGVLEQEEARPGFLPGKPYLDTFRAYVSGIQAWARVKDTVDGARVREETRRELVAAFHDVIEELPADQAVKVRLRLVKATERAS